MHQGNRWSPGQWGLAGRALLLAVTLGVLAYMVLWTRAFGLPRPAFLDPEGLAGFGITLIVIVAVCGAWRCSCGTCSVTHDWARPLASSGRWRRESATSS
jgi:hypothetical protein